MEPIAFRRLAREFARAEVNPNAASRNRESRFPAEAWRKLGDFGIFGPPRAAGMQWNEPERFAFRDRCSNLDRANADPDPAPRSSKNSGCRVVHKTCNSNGTEIQKMIPAAA